MSAAIAAPQAQRAEVAAWLAERESQAVPIGADIVHLSVAITIPRGGDVPRACAQHRPEWFANLGHLIRDVLRGAPEPMTAREIAMEVTRLPGHDVGNRQVVEIVANHVRASPIRWVGVAERVTVGQRRREAEC